MNGLRLAPVVLSSLLLVAHFLRVSNVLLVAASFALLTLLFVQRRWAARILQAFLLLGTLEWVRTTVVLLSSYRAADRPAGRMLLILGTVALLTLASALVFQLRSLKERYAA